MPENNETEPRSEHIPPVERIANSVASQSDAQLQANIQAAVTAGENATRKEKYDRTTVIAFGLLFILPAVIIVLSLIFLFPLIARSLHEEPSGATTLRSNSGDINQR